MSDVCLFLKEPKVPGICAPKIFTESPKLRILTLAWFLQWVKIFGYQICDQFCFSSLQRPSRRMERPHLCELQIFQCAVPQMKLLWTQSFHVSEMSTGGIYDAVLKSSNCICENKVIPLLWNSYGLSLFCYNSWGGKKAFFYFIFLFSNSTVWLLSVAQVVSHFSEEKNKNTFFLSH